MYATRTYTGVNAQVNYCRLLLFTPSPSTSTTHPIQEQFALSRAISVAVGGRESDAVLTTPETANRMADALAEARLRLLTVLKHVYWGSFQSGLLSPEGIRYVMCDCGV